MAEQVKLIINNDLRGWQEHLSQNEDPRLGRSHSDAAIRSAPQYLFPRRYLCEEQSIPEGVSISSMETTEDDTSTMSSADLDKRIKQLATSVANEDPDYQESTMNPFSKHDRYRSMRKIKPGDLAFLQNMSLQAPTNSNEPIIDEEDDDQLSSGKGKNMNKSLRYVF